MAPIGAGYLCTTAPCPRTGRWYGHFTHTRCPGACGQASAAFVGVAAASLSKRVHKPMQGCIVWQLPTIFCASSSRAWPIGVVLVPLVAYSGETDGEIRQSRGETQFVSGEHNTRSSARAPTTDEQTVASLERYAPRLREGWRHPRRASSGRRSRTSSSSTAARRNVVSTSRTPFTLAL